jgi:GTP cyclohydrolase II
MSTHQPQSDANRLILRRLHRAASDLRRGVPVVIGTAPALLVLAVETAAPETLAELASAGDPVLLLAPSRAAPILRQALTAGSDAVAVSIPPALLDLETLQNLADPAAPQPRLAEPLHATTAPEGADAAIGLAKIAHLLPALLAAVLPPGDTRDGLIAVPPAGILAYGDTDALGLRQVVSARVPLTDAPDSRVVAFRSPGSPVDHLAIVIGDPQGSGTPMIRIHSECFTGDVLGSLRCDCGDQLRGAIRRIAEDGAGVVLYLAQEGRGIGLVNKLRAYNLQDRGLDTMDANRVLGWGADERNFMTAATMLRSLGLTRVRVLTNNPDKLAGLAACGIDVAGREAHMMEPNGVNDDYLATKAARFGHLLD